MASLRRVLALPASGNRDAVNDSKSKTVVELERELERTEQALRIAIAALSYVAQQGHVYAQLEWKRAREALGRES